MDFDRLSIKIETGKLRYDTGLVRLSTPTPTIVNDFGREIHTYSGDMVNGEERRKEYEEENNIFLVFRYLHSEY